MGVFWCVNTYTYGSEGVYRVLPLHFGSLLRGLPEVLQESPTIACTYEYMSAYHAPISLQARARVVKCRNLQTGNCGCQCEPWCFWQPPYTYVKAYVYVVFIYIYTNILHSYTYIYIYMYIYMCIYIKICIYLCTHTHMNYRDPLCRQAQRTWILNK